MLVKYNKNDKPSRRKTENSNINELVISKQHQEIHKNTAQKATLSDAPKVQQSTVTTENPRSVRNSFTTNKRNKAKPLRSVDGGIIPEGRKLETITEMLTKKGYTSGLVATSSITHATPAAFYAHIDSRYKEVEIANQLLDSSIDISLGGGLEFFDLEQAKVSHKLITDKNSLNN